MRRSPTRRFRTRCIPRTALASPSIARLLSEPADVLKKRSLSRHCDAAAPQTSPLCAPSPPHVARSPGPPLRQARRSCPNGHRVVLLVPVLQIASVRLDDARSQRSALSRLFFFRLTTTTMAPFSAAVSSVCLRFGALLALIVLFFDAVRAQETTLTREAEYVALLPTRRAPADPSFVRAAASSSRRASNQARKFRRHQRQGCAADHGLALQLCILATMALWALSRRPLR